MITTYKILTKRQDERWRCIKEMNTLDELMFWWEQKGKGLYQRIGSEFCVQEVVKTVIFNQLN